MFPLALTGVLWTGVGLLLGAVFSFPYGSWVGLALFLLHVGPFGRWAFTESPPRHKRFTELRERFGSLGYCGSSAVACGQGPRGLWITRGFLDAELDHAALLEGVQAQGWRFSSRLLALPAGLRMAAVSFGKYRLGAGTAIDWLLSFLNGLAGMLELPWRLGRPALPTDLVAVAVRARGEAPAWLESFSWASPVSRLELRRLAAAAAAGGWRAGQEWPELGRPGLRPQAWLPALALLVGVVGAGTWGLFGLPFLAWGLVRLGLAGWLFRSRVTLEGTVTEGLEDLVSAPRPFLDDGAKRVELVGFAQPGEFQARGWRQGERVALGGFARYLLSSLMAVLFGATMTAFWWTGF